MPAESPESACPASLPAVPMGETSQQLLGRLIGALEELSWQEEHWIAQADYDQVLAVQEREEPLVLKIAELMLSPGVARSLASDLQGRAQKLLAAQQAKFTKIADGVEIGRQKLHGVEHARTRALRLRPAYGKLKTPILRPSFSAEG